MMSAYDAHLQFLIQAYKSLQANGQDVSIAILVYGEHLQFIPHLRKEILTSTGLTPGVPYPAQIRQTTAAIQHLLKSRAPESVSC